MIDVKGDEDFPKHEDWVIDGTIHAGSMRKGVEQADQIIFKLSAWNRLARALNAI